MNAIRTALLILLVALFADVAQAQSPHASLHIEGPSASALDREALAEALARELAMEVRDADEGARIVVTIIVTSRRATLTVRDSEGAAHRRITRLHRNPRERTEQLVIQITNLAHDEASELLAAMRRARPNEASAAPSEELPSEPTEAQTSPPQAQPEPEQALVEPQQALTEPQQAQVESTPPLPTSPVPDTEEADVVPPPEAARDVEGPPFLRIGLGAQLGSTPSPTGIDLVWLAGLEVAVLPLPFLALGVREVGGGLAIDSRWHAGGAAFVELMWRPIAEVELYGAVGAHVQYLGGADRPYTALGVAPLAGVGMRLIAERIFAFGIDTEVRVAATDSFHTGLQLVPQGAVVWTGGLHALFLIY